MQQVVHSQAPLCISHNRLIHRLPTSSPSRNSFRRRRQNVSAAAGAAAAPLAAASASLGQTLLGCTASLLTPSGIFSLTSALMVPIYGVMIFAPTSKLTRSVINSPVPALALSALYVYMLGQALADGLLESVITLFNSLTAPSYLPDMPSVAALFTSPAITSLAWVHLLLLDFYQARAVLIDGIQWSIVTGHSIALCFLFGPVGLLSHFVTRKLKAVITGERHVSVL